MGGQLTLFEAWWIMVTLVVIDICLNIYIITAYLREKRRWKKQEEKWKREQKERTEE